MKTTAIKELVPVSAGPPVHADITGSAAKDHVRVAIREPTWATIRTLNVIKDATVQSYTCYCQTMHPEQ